MCLQVKTKPQMQPLVSWTHLLECKLVEVCLIKLLVQLLSAASKQVTSARAGRMAWPNIPCSHHPAVIFLHV